MPLALARPPLPSHPYDVIVIGGGVNGVAIARECAFAGKRVLILEQNDFASGTSSRATRIIHGGLRYLEHGELGLVRESLRERELLLRTKPNLVRPKRFILAVPEHANPFSLRSRLALRMGMMFYRTMSGGKNRTLSAKAEMAALEGSLDSGARWTVLDYEDAQCEFPERLIADWLVEAVQAGAVARNHVEVLCVEVSKGKATGVRTRDRLTGEESRFSAEWTINATGPWADRVVETSSVNTARMIGGVRGSHILLPQFTGAPQAAVYAEATDGRPIFIIPWNGQTLVGTTEVADDADPARTAPTAKEVDYLLQSFQRIFPAVGFTMTDISSCFAGVRPLPYTRNAETSRITRKHFLRDHSDDGARGLISVIGGKLTTATSLGRECAAKIGVKTAAISATEFVYAGFSIMQDSRTNLGPQFVKSIVFWHGAASRQIIGVADQDPSLRQPLCSHSSHIVAEAIHAVRNELAVTLGDILLRRVPEALSHTWSQECTRNASQRIGRALGWSEADVQQAADEFEVERNAFLMDPAKLAKA